jgi:hypothetical protein
LKFRRYDPSNQLQEAPGCFYNISSRLVANRQQFSWKQSKTGPDQSLF